MTALRRLPRWLLVSLLAVNAAASLTVLALWWLQIWPNLAASWVGTVPALAAASGFTLRRVRTHLDDHHERIALHVEQQVAAVHARLDEQQGGTP